MKDKQIKVYSSEYCNPCKQLKQSLANSGLTSNIEFILIDEQPELAKELGIRTVPTTIIYHQGKEVSRISGNTPSEIIKATRNEVL